MNQIPAVNSRSVAKLKAIDWSQVNRILAVRTDNVGDMVMLSPALRAIKQYLPTCQVDLLASPAGTMAAPILPWVDDVITESVVWQQLGDSIACVPQREFDLIEDLRSRDYDACIIFTSFSQTPWVAAYVAYLAGIPIRIGESNEFGGAVLSHAVPPSATDLHQVDRNLHLLASVGIETTDDQMQVVIPREIAVQAARILRKHSISGDFIVAAPGASCPSRRYSLENFVHIARRITDLTGIQVVFVGSSTDARRFEQIPKDVVNIMGETSVPVLASIIDRSLAVVCNNSGPLHLAEATKTPCLVAYGGTELVSQWGPRNRNSSVFYRSVVCSPCHLLECPFDNECLDIDPELIIAATLSVIAHEEEIAL